MKVSIDDPPIEDSSRFAQQLREARRTIEALEANYLALLESSPDAMVVVSLEGLILYANPASKALLHGEGDNLVGQAFQLPFPQDKKSQSEITRRDGEMVTVEMSALAATWMGESVHVISMRDITHLVRVQEEIRALSLMDELTGLYNRRAFLTLAQQQLKIAVRAGHRLSLLFVGLDNVVSIDESLGRSARDAALIAVARVLKSNCRESDIVARMGWDDFAILTPVVTEEGAEALATRLKECWATQRLEEVSRHRLSLCVGVAHHEPENSSTISGMLARAEKLMCVQKWAT